MPEGKSTSQRWEEFRPSKAIWFWSCVACIVLTIIVGFTAGGWVTGGSANTMATDATDNARVNLASALCVNNFVTSASADDSFAKLKEASSYEQDDFIEEGGWAKITGLDEQVDGTAGACAERIVAMDELPAREVEPKASTADEANNKG